MWSSNQSIIDKRGVSSTTAADDIDDGCVQDIRALNADEEHDDPNRKGGYHEGDKDGVHMRNQLWLLCARAVWE